MRPDRRPGAGTRHPSPRPAPDRRHGPAGATVAAWTEADRERLLADLGAGAAALALPLTAQMQARLIDYLALLRRWNSVYNLTAITGSEAMLTLHLLDSLAIVQPLHRALGQRLAAPDTTSATTHRLLDVGSGGGLPGVVLAITCPWLAVHCVDTVGKKASFIRQVSAELGLANLQAHHARVEALALPPFDIVCSRAFASLADFTRLSASLLAPQGRWLAMKGQQPAEELAALPTSVQVDQLEPLQVPGEPGERCIVWMSAAGTASPVP
ncbi:MAG: hypothetical protein RL722_1160 [Pseudomonadota bacterium]|jgi:16S rRNA (guanine527-N7)-methyltransferase